jgi:integrase
MLYKRDDSPFIWYKFVVGGAPVRGSTETADWNEARERENQARLDARSNLKKGIKRGRTWDHAALAYLNEMPEGDNKRNTRYILAWLQQHLGGKRLEDIDEDLLTEIRDKKIAEINAKKQAAARRGKPSRWASAQPSSVNRIFTGVVSPVLEYALRRKWVAIVPATPRLDEPEKDPVWATREKALKLVSIIGGGRHGALRTRIVMLDLEVGWRRRNVTHLTWPQIDFERRAAWVTAEEAKAGKGIPTPLSDLAIEILRAQWNLAEKGADGAPVLPWVFPYRGRPINQTSTKAFRAARAKAGLPAGFTFHSLRHTWATWHRLDKTPLAILKELGGWESDKMVERYAHFDASHLAEYVQGRTSLGGGHESGHAAKMFRVAVESKPLIAEQSGNSSVGRAQPCQGRGPSTSFNESISYLLQLPQKPPRAGLKHGKNR